MNCIYVAQRLFSGTEEQGPWRQIKPSGAPKGGPQQLRFSICSDSREPRMNNTEITRNSKGKLEEVDAARAVGHSLGFFPMRLEMSARIIESVVTIKTSFQADHATRGEQQQSRTEDRRDEAAGAIRFVGQRMKHSRIVECVETCVTSN